MPSQTERRLARARDDDPGASVRLKILGSGRNEPIDIGPAL